MAGMIIALEGIEGAGKTLHAKLLAEYLKGQGYPCVSVKEPSDFLGRVIKEQNHPAEVNALLFAADRLKQFKKKVRPALKEGKVVVTDRSVLSSFAYQSARGVNLGWLETINKCVPLPNLAIVLDVNPDVGLGRIGGRNETSCFDKRVHNVAFQKKVRSAYYLLAKTHSGLMKIVDVSDRSAREVQALIRKIVLKHNKFSKKPRS